MATPRSLSGVARRHFPAIGAVSAGLLGIATAALALSGIGVSHSAPPGPPRAYFMQLANDEPRSAQPTSTGAATVTASASASPSASPFASPSATASPTASPSPGATVTITQIPDGVKRGERLFLYATAPAESNCNISILLPGGGSVEGGSKTTNKRGEVKWDLLIPANSPIGTATVTVVCGAGQTTAQFTIRD